VKKGCTPLPISFLSFSMSTPNTPWFASTLALVGLIAGYTIANGFNGVTAAPSAPAAPSVAGDTVIPDQPAAPSNPAGVDDDPMLGDANAPVTLIEFTDYQCPFCGRHYDETYGKIKSDYIDTGKVKLVVRDYPLSFHQFAQKGAEAANCADDQGKYWEMHDKLFGNQAVWSALPDAVPTFKQYAKDIGLNTAEFDDCLDNDAHADEISKDLADGTASGVSGTPGFWVVGPDNQSQFISGAYPYETFAAAFDGMLQ
jgi:protein-disulfide isomerase